MTWRPFHELLNGHCSHCVLLHLPESLLSFWVNADLEVDRVLLSIARDPQLITALGPVQA